MMGERQVRQGFRIRTHRSSGRSAPPIANFGDRGQPSAEELAFFGRA